MCEDEVGWGLCQRGQQQPGLFIFCDIYMLYGDQNPIELLGKYLRFFLKKYTFDRYVKKAVAFL